MTSFHSTDWALRVMHIWSNLQVHREAGMHPRKRFSTAKIAQLLTPMTKEGLMVGILISTTIRKESSLSQNLAPNPGPTGIRLCFIRPICRSKLNICFRELDYYCFLITPTLSLLCIGLTVYFVRLTLDLTTKLCRSIEGKDVGL